MEHVKNIIMEEVTGKAGIELDAMESTIEHIAQVGNWSEAVAMVQIAIHQSYHARVEVPPPAVVLVNVHRRCTPLPNRPQVLESSNATPVFAAARHTSA